jgi:putative restriction endonuclease
LLTEFGPTRQSYHPEYPFWRLQNDGLWIVDEADRLERRTGQSDIPNRELLDKDVHAHFTAEIAQRLDGDPSLVADVALRLLDGHFPVLRQDGEHPTTISFDEAFERYRDFKENRVRKQSFPEPLLRH